MYFSWHKSTLPMFWGKGKPKDDVSGMLCLQHHTQALHRSNSNTVTQPFFQLWVWISLLPSPWNNQCKHTLRDSISKDLLAAVVWEFLCVLAALPLLPVISWILDWFFLHKTYWLHEAWPLCSKALFLDGPAEAIQGFMVLFDRVSQRAKRPNLRTESQ